MIELLLIMDYISSLKKCILYYLGILFSMIVVIVTFFVVYPHQNLSMFYVPNRNTQHLNLNFQKWEKASIHSYLESFHRVMSLNYKGF